MLAGVLVLLAVGLGVPPERALDAQPAGLIRAVGAVGMTVGNMERSTAFYSNVLGFEKVSDVEVWGEAYERFQGVLGLRMRVVRMRLGDEAIELTEYLTPRGRPIPVDSRSHDRWFQHIAIIVSDMDRAYASLRQHRVEHASLAPQRLPDWNANAGGIRAFYFKDPDGHPLEILWFHTAIVVSDTAQSLRCYRDTLGLRVVGESENYGPEQERLNNVFGARLRITTLRAQAGPGFEFLEYLTPRDGRPVPADARANDLAHWQTTLVSQDAEAVARGIRGSPCAMLSPGVVAPADRALGFTKGLLIRDPDGHALAVVQP
ncbi:MAG: glyoxalase [Candidatus Rokuibacteriota bacterium]|nr:MAG: glyoxalase [Candidatus Rokubacteria bacterium]